MENQPLTTNQQLEKLPNATAVLILGICSLVFGCLLVGLICGIVGLALAKKPTQMYFQNPQKYINYGALNAGRIMSIIGVILGAIAIIWGIISALFLGGSFLLFDSDLFEDLLDF
jgi:hypothetical protein